MPLRVGAELALEDAALLDDEEVELLEEEEEDDDVDELLEEEAALLDEELEEPQPELVVVRLLPAPAVALTMHLTRAGESSV